MLERKILPQCVVSPHKNAVIDAAHRSIVNHEIFYFAGAKEKATFDADPLKYCGLLTDPVSRVRFHPEAEAPTMEHAGRAFYFSADSTFQTFASMPDSFAVPRFGMIPKKTSE